jgi:hypothetical protein
METECASCEVRTGLYVLLQVASISQLTVSRLSKQCGILNISQPYRPPRPVTGIALLYLQGDVLLYSQYSLHLRMRGLLRLHYKFGHLRLRILVDQVRLGLIFDEHISYFYEPK